MAEKSTFSLANQVQMLIVPIERLERHCTLLRDKMAKAQTEGKPPEIIDQFEIAISRAERDLADFRGCLAPLSPSASRQSRS